MAENCEILCEGCRQPTVRFCEECQLSYCYKCKYQDHWAKCGNYEICCDEEENRFFVKAVRDCLPGEIIFTELPVVLGPKLPVDDGYVSCVGCCRLIPPENSFQCPECAWPACNPNCEGLKNITTHGLECQVLKIQEPPTEISTKTFRYEILLPLRTLCLQIVNTEKWETLRKRIEENSQSTNNSDIEHVEFLSNNFFLLLKTSEQETGVTLLPEKSNELLQKIFAFLKTQTFNFQNVLILYPVSTLIKHSCTPNCFFTIEQNKITIRANSTISKNTPITLSYTNLFQGTSDRILHLKNSKNIFCTCLRCKDPTEFNTFLSSLKCFGTITEPCNGNQLPIDPTNETTLWVCDKCKIELPNDQMVKFLKHLGDEVDKALSKIDSADELEEFLGKVLMFLHPNHFYVCRVKLALMQMYGDDLVNTKIEICKSLLEIVRKLYPNGGVFLAELLHELFGAKIASLTKRNENNDEEIEDLSELIEEMKKNTEALFDEKFCKIIEEDEEKFKIYQM